MKQKLAHFLKSEAGAATVDWVVLTAAIIGLAMVVLVPFAISVDVLGERVGNSVAEYTPHFSNE